MKRLFILYISLFCSIATSAQIPQNIVIDSVGRPEEPTIAIDPGNPNNMVAGSNINNYYISTDAGFHWSKGTLSSSRPVDGDPVLIADTGGAFYYMHITDNAMACQKLSNISGAWSNGSFAGDVPGPAMDDKPGIGIDLNTGTLYMCWTKFDRYHSAASTDSSNIYFAKSTDHGASWSTAIRINNEAGNCSDDDPTVEGAIPCVGPSGEIYVGWAAYDAIKFNRSLDGGNSWLPIETTVTDVPGGWNYLIPGIFRCNGLPYTACDLSHGPHRGNIYINWTDQRNGVNNTDVWLCKSSDSGATWSPPMKVNDDTVACQQFMSSMTVDPGTGYVYVLFYDRRNYAGIADSNFTDVYLAVSKDGAATFRNYRINEYPFYPDAGTFFGDYTYISAINNVVRPIWGSLMINGPVNIQQVFTAIIDSPITGSSVNNVKQPENLLHVYPNPVTDQSAISWELAAPGIVCLYISDISGRTIAVLEDKEMAAGGHNISFSASALNMSPGLYFLTLRSENFSQTQKIVLAR